MTEQVKQDTQGTTTEQATNNQSSKSFSVSGTNETNTNVSTQAVDLSNYVHKDKLQDEINSVLRERLPRKEQAVTGAILAELGFDSIEAATSELKRLRESEKTFNSERENLKTELERFRESESRRNTRNVLDPELIKLGLNQATLEKAYTLAQTDNIDFVSALEDGKVNSEKLTELVKQFRESNPFLFASNGAGGSPSNGDAQGARPNVTDDELRKEAQRKYARL